jgi:hypothetical protein
MASKRTSIPKPDPAFAHVAVGPSNEELNQRQAEIEQKRAENGYPKVEFLADAKDKATDGFGDLDFDPLGLTDPLMALKNEYGRPGFSLKLLSEQCNDRLGRRGYQIVKDENGDPVKMGKMVLGEIPERFSNARKKAVIEKSNDELRSIKDAQRESVERMKSDAKGMGLTILEAGETVNNVGNGQDYQMGISVDRGEGAN